MATARQALADLGFADVSSYVNSGNLLFSATGPASEHEVAIRARLEAVFGFELTTFVRTAAQVRDLVGVKPFGTIAPGQTHSDDGCGPTGQVPIAAKIQPGYNSNQG